jgi:hypothetical protein
MSLAVQIEDWDFVRDPMDNSIRQVASVVEDTLYMVDGGVMGAGEVTEVFLESEMYG